MNWSFALPALFGEWLLVLGITVVAIIAVWKVGKSSSDSDLTKGDE